ncbi:MAG: histidine phosphatase family protein [Thermoplasmatales archaeon]
MKKVILVRHGESFANVNNIISEELDKYPLTQRGVEQTLFTGEQLKDLKFNGILYSPVLRTKQTAKTLAEITGLTAKEDKRVREAGLGPYNGYKVDDVPKMSREDLGMETWESILKRMRETIKDYDGCYIIVSHGLPIRVLTASFLGLDEASSFGIDIKPASMTAIDVSEGKVLTIGTLLLTENVKKKLTNCR